MKNSPTVDMKTSGTNLRIDVQSWTDPMFFTPLRLIAAGIHRPIRATTTDHVVVITKPSMRFSRTYFT